MSLANHFPSSPLSGPLLRSRSSPTDRQDSAREAAEAIPPVPNWDELSLEKIYNQLIVSGEWKNDDEYSKRIKMAVGCILPAVILSGTPHLQ